MINKVHKTWMTYKHIRPPLSDIEEIADRSGPRMRFFFGKYDRIIGQRAVHNLKSFQSLKDNIKMLPCGHSIQKSEITEEIARFYA
jgi:hypothetical protein